MRALPGIKYEQGGRKIAAEHLYAHIISQGHEGLSEARVLIIDKTKFDNPTQCEAFGCTNYRRLYPGN